MNSPILNYISIAILFIFIYLFVVNTLFFLFEDVKIEITKYLEANVFVIKAKSKMHVATSNNTFEISIIGRRKISIL